MALDIDTIIDRRRLKRSLLIWRVLAIVAMVAIILVAGDTVPRIGPLELADEPHVARITVSGVIIENRQRIEMLAKVAEDGNAKALIVYINSPGGTVVGGEQLYRALRAVARSDKPVVAVLGTTAASAGYMIAIGADRIFAHEGTITGSIGVILQTADLTGMLQKLGIATEAIKSGPLKAVPSPFETLTPVGRQAAQEVVDATQQMFLTMVGDRRSLDAVQLQKLSDGRVYTGRQALDVKLVDAIGGERQAREWLESQHGIKASLPVHEVKRQESAEWLRDAIGSLGGKTLFSERLTLDGLISLWHPDLQ
jgi:protease-4